MPRPSRFGAAALFAVGAAAVALTVGDLPRLPAQAKPAPVAVPPAYPTLATPANLGAARGKAVDLVLTGTNLTDTTGVWVSFPAKVTIPDGQKDAAKLTVKLDVPADAPLGLHSIRVATKSGVSNARPFCIDEFPAVAEDGKNKTKAAPQVVPVPCVVTGTVESETGDFFKFPVSAGQPITIEVIGRRLGAALDPVLLVYDGTGKELGGVYADDTPGLQTDARVVYTPKAAGELIAEVRDTTYRGGGGFEYRLRIGNFPGVTTAFPLAVERGKSAAIGFAGPGAEAVKPVTLTAPTDPAVKVVYATPRRADGGAGWPVPVRVSDFPEAVEQEPNNEAAKANKLPVPGGVSARFAEKNDVDHFSFPGKKGQKLVIEAETYTLNAPTEVYLRVLDAKGAELAKSNPVQAGAKVEFTPAADGDFLVACEHLNYLAGPSEVYHLTVEPATPDFGVTLGLDRFDVPPGGVGLLPVVGVTRANGFAGPIELTVAGMEGLTGALTLPAGANPLPAAPVYLPVTVKAGTKPGPLAGYIKATAKIDGKDVVRAASLLDAAKAAMGNMPNPPAELTTQIAAAVVPEPAFTLEVKFEKPEVAKGGSLKGTATVKRSAGFADAVTIVPVGFPANITPTVKPVAKDATAAEVTVAAAAAAAAGPAQYIFRGTAKVGGKDVAVNAVPVTVTVVEPPKKVEPKKEEPKKK